MIQNYFSPLEFRVTIKRLPNIEFFTQRTSIPGINGTPVAMGSPLNRFYQTPDKLEYSNLDLSFIVDENMNNYLEVFNWITGITFPQNYKQYENINESKEGTKSDISVLILSSHKNAKIKVDYISCFPIALSQIELDTTQNDVVYPQANVTFQYDYFTISQIA